MDEMRKSNFELLRIFSMLFIILYHMILHGKILQNCVNNGVSTIFNFLEYLVIVGVNIFILITGYFQSKSNFKQSKLWQLINSSLFYKAAIIIIFSSFGIIRLSKLEIFDELFILNLDEYWFIKYYFFLYCLSPFLNELINNLSKEKYRKLLIVSVIIFSIIPYITGMKAFPNDGYSLYNFILLYFIGAYFRKFCFEDNFIIKRFSKKLVRIVLLVTFFSCAILNYLIVTTSYSLQNINSIFNEVFGNLISMNIAYSNPIIMLQSLALFLLFSTFNIKSKFINSISKCVIGVYLIHDNNFVRKELYKFLHIDNRIITSYSFIFYSIGMALLIFAVCSLIEWFRQVIFRFIYRRKISQKLRTKYYDFINSVYVK